MAPQLNLVLISQEHTLMLTKGFLILLLLEQPITAVLQLKQYLCRFQAIPQVLFRALGAQLAYVFLLQMH